MNKIISILSHCNTDEKLSKLRENIEILKKNTNIPILLNSHITLPQDILDKVDLPAPLWPTINVLGDFVKLSSVKCAPVDKKFFQRIFWNKIILY